VCDWGSAVGAVVTIGKFAVGQFAANSEIEAVDAGLEAKHNELELQKTEAQRLGGERAARIQGQAAQLEGQQRVAFASSGVALEGTAIDVMAASRLGAQFDADLARNNATREALGYKRQQGQVWLQHRAMMATGNASTAAAFAGAVGTAGAYGVQGAINYDANYGGGSGGSSTPEGQAADAAWNNYSSRPRVSR
jgi:hypothetical protein